MELRQIEVDNLEYRVGNDTTPDGDGKQEYCTGMAVVYDKRTRLWDGYEETIARGAFDKWLKNNPEIKSFINHDPHQVLATTRSNPKLHLEDTPDGLLFSAPIPDTTYGRDLKENLKRKNIRGASFTFIVEKNGSAYEEDEHGNVHRTITRAQLWELGPVTSPAFPQTKVGLRSRDDIMAEARAAIDATKQERLADGNAEDKIKRNGNALNLKKRKLQLINNLS